ncbi:MAG: head GIN domain-containing protein [Bacteroidales bacterium]
MKTATLKSVIAIALVMLTSPLLNTTNASASNLLPDSDDRNRTEKYLDLKPFSKIEVSSGVDVHLIRHSSHKAQIVANGNVIDDIVVKVVGNTLKVYVENKKVLIRTDGIDVYVYFTELNSIIASGGSDVETEDNTIINGDELHISGSGGTDISLEINVRKLTCELSGGNDTKLVGRAVNATYNISGGADFDGKKLRSKNVNINVSGGADAYVHASESLDANASGAADIYYYGNPRYIKTNSSGGADIRIGD